MGEVRIMTKRKPDPFEQMIQRGYNIISNVPVYCKLCGKEILWESTVQNRNKDRAEYEQEMTMGVHTECLNAYLANYR
jgi:superfamily II RNA helicase